MKLSQDYNKPQPDNTPLKSAPQIFKWIFIFIFIVLGTNLIGLIDISEANTVEQLKAKIETSENEIQRLEKEIAQYQNALNKTKQESNSLKTEINKIDLTRKELGSNISLTQEKLNGTENNIKKLIINISDKEALINSGKETIGETLRQIKEEDQKELIEIFLATENISSLWNQTDRLASLNIKIENKIKELTGHKKELETQKYNEEQLKVKLSSLKQQLADQKKIADQAKKEKDQLLAETKNQESSYQKLLNDKIARKKAVEEEIRKTEEELKIVLNPNLLPTGSVLSWPLEKIRITQYFGNTEFASKNSAVYNGRGHNGVDFGAPVGTPILSSADGTVVGFGDTDLTCRGASYGKWILINHNNGLSTLYAHLSLIKVKDGEVVKNGQIIGYSGNTGYSTGPHLHYTVYASQAVQIGSLKSKVAGCGTYRIPISAHNGYLNPLIYLPSL